MDERKRPASYDNDETAPPQKRQATSHANGNTKSHQDVDMPGRDELERFQKDAILRQMQEYKREKSTLEARLNDLMKKAANHDDHLRAVDAWFTQLLDEIKTAAGSLKDSSPYRPLPSTILSSDNLTFGKYLESRSNAISVAISDIFSTGYKSAPEIRDLSDRIAQLLSTEKSHVNELEKIRLEKEQMQERLETASMRYMVAEKKLDRAKSTTIAKLERQAMVGGRSESGSGLGGSTDGTSGKNESTNGQVDGESLAEAEAAKKKAVAASAKQAEQLEKLSAENDKLTSQVTSLTLKMSHLSDEDYAHTDLFKQLKHQHEDVVIKLNGLEAANADLQQETKRLREERSSFRMQLDAETQAAVSEKEMQLTKAESDLARIRTTRDELNADVQIRKAAQEQERASVNQVNQLVAVKDDRIATLEAEIERLSSSLSEATPSELDSLPIEELRAKYQNLENQYTMLNKELTSMSTAYKRLSATVSQKVGNASDQEEKAIRLSAEKAKADQKYFAAMKAKEARDQEVRVLRAQNSKSSDIVSQLKDAEAATQTLVVNLERQIAESKDLLSTLETKHRAVQRQVSEKDILVEGLRKQVSELKTSLVSKDSAYWTASNAQRKAEVEVEKLKIDVAEKEKRIETWKGRGLGSENEHYEALRNLAICTVCRKNFKDTAVKTCGHVFCRECVDERLQSRMRKCPNCNKAFGANDHMRITL